MFNIFGRAPVPKKSNLFEDNFDVFDADAVYFKERIRLNHDRKVFLYENTTLINNEKTLYYELVYEVDDDCRFVVYHTLSKDLAGESFEFFRVTLNNLNQSITNVKTVAFENLRLIMGSLKLNNLWTSTHIAARVNFEKHFLEAQDIALLEINTQFKPDGSTPLHLALVNHHTNIIRLILAIKPDLNLVDFKQYSVLHFAALSTLEIFNMILALPGMLERVPWKNNQGSTALHIACFSSNYDIVFEFLKFGLTVSMLTLTPPKASPKKTSRSHSKRKRSGLSRNQGPSQGDRQKIIRFTEEDFSDMDCQDIVLAGCPLHWVKHRRLMEKLIKYRFNLNTINMIGDTPLHVMTKRSRMKCVINLLCSGANVNAHNKFGNTALHHSVKQGDILISQTIIVFDANINYVNKVHESIRHLAAKDTTFNQQVILYLLSSIGAKRCSQLMSNCSDGCSYNGSFEGRCSPALYDLTSKFPSFFSNSKNSTIFNTAFQRSEDQIDKEQQRSNMLLFDGGGIKGLITVQILIEIQKYLDRPIIDYFTWISGTSTGSFISVFLTIGKSLTQIRSIYFQMKDKILVGKRPYDSEPLERFIKEVIGPEIKMEDLLTKYKKYVMIPAVLYDRKPMSLHFFRSFPSHYELLNIPDFEQGFEKQPSREEYAWRACRASGAAPTYFSAFGPFIDGGLMSNNPTLDFLTEFEFYNNALKTLGRAKECHQLDLIISIGTGMQRTETTEKVDISAIFSFNPMEINNSIRYFAQMINLLLLEVCNTDNHVVQRAEAFCMATNIPFFRLNPIFTELIDLDESFDYKIVNLLWETKRLMHLRLDEIQQIANYLKKFTKFSNESESFLPTNDESSEDSCSKTSTSTVDQLTLLDPREPSDHLKQSKSKVISSTSFFKYQSPEKKDEI